MHVGPFAGQQPGVEQEAQGHHHDQLENKGVEGAGGNQPGGPGEIDGCRVNRGVEGLKAQNTGG